MTSPNCVGEQSKNVLFLCVDDLNTWWLEDANRYSGTVIAPSIRRFAKQGMLFTRAYCAAPKCSPSRTAILSGIAPWNSGIYQSSQSIENSPALKSAVSLPQHFQSHGYYTASAGKVSHGYSVRHAWNRFMPHKRDPAPPAAPLSKIGHGEKDWGATHLPESQMGDHKYADFAIEELHKNHDQPFFIACGLFHPHYPWYVPQKYLDQYPVEDIKLPESLASDLSDVPDEGVDLANSKAHQTILKANEYRQAVQGYLASTTFADAQIGRVLDALDASPYRDNTIVVLWSDHGFHLGEKTHWAKSTLWEEATHANLMFRVPGITQPNQVCERVVSLLDIAPTLLELCQLPPLDHHDGASLVPLFETPDLAWNRPAITGFLDMWKLDVHLSIRTRHHRYIRYGRGGEEFYDRELDPHEWVNQINNPTYAAEIESLRNSLPDAVPAIEYKRRKGRDSSKQ